MKNQYNFCKAILPFAPFFFNTATDFLFYQDDLCSLIAKKTNLSTEIRTKSPGLEQLLKQDSKTLEKQKMNAIKAIKKFFA